MKKRLFVDMDGTLAVFRPLTSLEQLYEPGYFLHLEAHRDALEAVKELIQEEDIEIFILSSVLSDSPYALTEKNLWLDHYLPEVDSEHRIFPPCGRPKADYIPGGTTKSDYLLDDYTINLLSWDPPGTGIKLLNGINHTRGSWKENRLSLGVSGKTLAENLRRVILDGETLREEKPSIGSIAIRNDRKADITFESLDDEQIDLSNLISEENRTKNHHRGIS